MSALTADSITQRYTRGAELQSFKIANAQQIYIGSYVCLNSSGLVVPFSGANGQIPLGRAQPTPRYDLGTALLGNTSATPVPEVVVNIASEINEKVTVSGASTNTLAMGKAVYLNGTDNIADYTLTRPTTGSQPHGVIVRWYSGSVCDVLVFSFAERWLASRNGNGRGNALTIHVGHIEAGTGSPLTVTASQFGTKWIAPFHGKITSAFAYCTLTMTGGPVTVTPTIDPANGGSPVAITGGVMVLTQTLAGKTQIAGTAVTAGNEFHEGDAIDLLTSTVTNFTAGGVDFYLQVESLPGV